MQNPLSSIQLPSNWAQMDDFNVARTSRKRKADSDPEVPLRPNVTGHRAPYPNNLPYGLVNGCNICPKKSRRIVCSSCKAVHYCTPGHQALDHPNHQTICNRIQNLFDLKCKTQLAIDRHPEDNDAPADIFDTAGPSFWPYKGTRKYLYICRDLVYELVKLNTEAAIRKALNDTLTLLQLDPEDHLGMRCLAPSLFLRLNQDQRCYDFCKWWVTEGSDSDFNWIQEDLPLMFEDAFESAEVFERIRDYGADPATFSDLSFLLAILLLKIRMLRDVKFLQHYRGLDFAHYSRSSIVLKDLWKYDREGEEYLPFVRKLEDQVRRLYRAVGRANKHFWPAFMQPWAHLSATPLSFTLGDETEMQIKLQECFNAWMETLGATGPIRDLMEGDDMHWYSMSGNP